MKVLFVYQEMMWGGCLTVLLNRYKLLKDSHEIHFAFLKDFNVMHVYKELPHNHITRNEVEWNQLLQNHSFDAIFIIDNYHVLDWLKKGSYPGKVYFEVHTTYEKNLTKVIELPKYPFIKKILTPSLYLYNKLVSEYRVSPKHLGIFPNFVCESDPTRKLPASKVPIILWIGRLDSLKNWREFLSFAAAMKKSKKIYKYWIVGGYTATDEVMSDFLSEILENDLENDVQWLTQVDYENMDMIYELVKASQGVYVSTSLNESYGLTIQEAMSHHLPVVISDRGAPLEFFAEEEKARFVYKLGDIEDLMQKVLNRNQKVKYMKNQNTPLEFLKIFQDLMNGTE